MSELPSGANNGAERSFSIADFLEAGKDKLSLSVVAGAANLGRVIEEPIVNRPGLALAGFYEHFAWRRLQLIGQGEMAYLRSMSPESRTASFRALVDHRAFCFIFSCGLVPSAEEIAIAEAAGCVIMTSPLQTRSVANLGTFVMGRLSAPATSLYGTMVEVYGLGVMFEGDPGLGKSETALGLIKRGFALVADDLTCIRKDVANNLLYGSAADSTAGFMEIRGIGIIDVRKLFGIASMRGEKRLQLIVSFRRLSEVKGEIDRTGSSRQVKTILGVDIPNVIIPVSEGRDLVNLVESAVMQQKALDLGWDPVEDLSERLKVRADARSGNLKKEE